MMKKQSKLLTLSISFLLMGSSCKKDNIINKAMAYNSETKIDSLAADNSDDGAHLVPKRSTEHYVKNQLLIKFKSETSAEAKTAVFQSIEGQVLKELLTQAMKDDGEYNAIYQVYTPMEPKQAQAIVQGNPCVAIAEPNHLYSPVAVSNDSYFKSGKLWGVYSSTTKSKSPFKSPYGSQAADAWAAGNTGSDKVIIAIIDQGFNVNHEDLKANTWVNPYEKIDGKDNDGNGYIDDINGWDFFSGDNTPYDIGRSGTHGTHVAGTIGAVGGNGIGVAGVCWKVKMISCALFKEDASGSDMALIEAIDYITTLKTKHRLNIVATNNSYAGPDYSWLIYDAIDRANKADILYIAAASNDGLDNDITPFYPASYDLPNIISVGAINSGGAKPYWSNYGATSVDIFAPGVNILSTFPGTHPYVYKIGGPKSPLYDYLDGTSMACPHVTGAAALFAAKNKLGAAGIKNAILSSGTVVACLRGKCVTGKTLNVSTFY
jgi:hypothetical protein